MILIYNLGGTEEQSKKKKSQPCSVPLDGVKLMTFPNSVKANAKLRLSPLLKMKQNSGTESSVFSRTKKETHS